jgi:hypothetical protein
MTYNNLGFKEMTIRTFSNWSMRSIAFLKTDKVFFASGLLCRHPKLMMFYWKTVWFMCTQTSDIML